MFFNTWYDILGTWFSMSFNVDPSLTFLEEMMKTKGILVVIIFLSALPVVTTPISNVHLFCKEDSASIGLVLAKTTLTSVSSHIGNYGGHC